MVYWIFDLDYTLYNISKEFPFSYNLIKQNDDYLALLISFLPDQKIIFTNSNNNHCNLCLDIMNIKNKFGKIVTKDNNYMKPDIRSYINFIKMNNIYNNDRCVFFEDTEVNLKFAKMFGWTTVFIGHINNKNYIDYSFNTIHDALEFFIRE